MKINYYSMFYYLVVLVFLMISIVQGYQFIDYSYADQKDKYATFNEVDSKWSCRSLMLFKVIDDSGIKSIVYNPPSFYENSLFKSPSPSESMFYTSLLLSPSSNQYEIQITTIDLLVHTETFNYICEMPPTLDLEFINNNLIMVQHSLFIPNPYFFLVKLKNVNKKVPPTIKVVSGSSLYNPTPMHVSSDTYLIALAWSLNSANTFEGNTTFNISIPGQNIIIEHQVLSIATGYENEYSNCNLQTYPIGDLATSDIWYPDMTLLYQCNYNENKRAFQTFKKGPIESIGILVEGNFTKPTFFNRYRISASPQSVFSFTAQNYIIGKSQVISNSGDLNYIGYPLPYIIGLNIEHSNEILTFQAASTNATFKGDTYSINTRDIILGYPFGYSQGNARSYIKKADFYVTICSICQAIVANLDSTTVITQFGDTSGSRITDITTTKIRNSPWLVIRLKIQGLTAFNYFQGFGDYTNLASGDLYDGEYEFVVLETLADQLLFNFGLLPIYDALNNNLNINTLDTNEIGNLAFSRFSFRLLNLTYVTDARFERNDIDVTNQNVDNILYIYTTQVDKDYWPSMMVLPFGKSHSDIVTISGHWNESCECYSFPFTVPMNYPTGEFEFFLNFDTHAAVQTTTFLLKSMFGPNAVLRVYSEQADLLGPAITYFGIGSNIVTVPDGVDTLISWTIGVHDPYNGFKYGVVSIVSSLDLVRHNFTFTLDNKSGGDMYTSYYQFEITVNGRCKSQSFYIQYAYLEDRAGYFSVHQEGGEYPYSFVYQPNYPFSFSLDIKNFSNIQVTCQNSIIDTTPPDLMSLAWFLPTNNIDETDAGQFFNNSRQVEFHFVVMDQNGILKSATPVIYLHDKRLSTLSCYSILMSIVGTEASYKCVTEIPIGFGMDGGIKISLYGIVDNQSNFRGYSITQLADAGFTNTIVVTSSNRKSISSTKEVYSSGGDIIIIGRILRSIIHLLVDYKNGTITKYDAVVFNTDTVIVYNIPGEILVPEIIVTLYYNDVNDGFLYTNSLIAKVNVNPWGKKEQTQTSSSSLSVDSSSSGSNDPPVTNKPQTCINNCGGSDHGVCTDNGCVCKSPWIGLDCSSQVIIIDPIINTTTPSTNITVPTNDKNTAIYYAIISVVALNELDKDKQLFKQHQFPQWIVNNNTISKYSQYTNSSYLYSSSFEYNNITTNINVSIDYFNVNTPVNITFASQIFTMNPYSLKYSVNISEYSFSSSLNTLQLVLLASIETEDNSDECSSKQFGDTVESDSEYIKMQVNDHSLYGRFIKRGVVDGRIKTVTNTQLDNQYNSISTQSQIQSYIGINIPFYKKSVELDPDFSVLIDNRPASNDDNAICGGEKKSKLTSAQLAGIIIGAVAFTAIIVISVTYVIYKHKREKLFMRNIVNKLKHINK